MSLNNTPNAERVHIGIFGKRNAGKSSLINAITGQDLAVVSEVSGTTTDPVFKAMEILPLGPVLLIDTPGLDDTGELGELRVHKSWQILNKTDIALLVVDERQGISPEDEAILNRIRLKQIPCIIVMNKHDLMPENQKASLPENTGFPIIEVSASTGYHIPELRELLASVYHVPEEKFRIVGDLLSPSDFAVLVVPIDKAAPKGRLILPQQQTIRDILEADATAVVCKEYELRETLENLGKKPKIVITDSQVFAKV
ncbi:MAG: [FeFe] hydrogenase H-cluster maturation GTPase HydF, partial [Bulleidia sp.]